MSPGSEAQSSQGAHSAIDLEEGRVRSVIDAVRPTVDGDRFAAKCVAGKPVNIEAHCFCDGHDRLRVVMEWQRSDMEQGIEVAMTAQPNDAWCADFVPPQPGRYCFMVTAWVDRLESWRHELARRTDPSDIRVALLLGAGLIEASATRASGTDALLLAEWLARLRRLAGSADAHADEMKSAALDDALLDVAGRYADRSFAARATRELIVDRARAQFGSWYEMFPRSASPEAGRHGTFRDVEARLPYVAEMGFDVLYLPPIHPIGRVNRKGRNNALVAADGDVGSPWAIGSREGGHKDVLPKLGTLDDFRGLVEKARTCGLEIALDIAFQCAPDHPYVEAHPQWFRHRPDGNVQYAENPPKKYQDIYPFDFESEDWRGLWRELKSIFDFWIDTGVTIFRVDNPHTKSFPFWEWVIDAIRREHPETIFLAEAFTRPKVMHGLAKLGFTQSYTYFTWRNSKQEITDYFTELTQGVGRDYFRPNLWPNTPDILHETLQSGLRAVYAARLILAATLAANYGIYGPPFELMESAPREAGSEEYRDSEKYQLRLWDIDRRDSLRQLIARINRIRRENPALQSDRSLRFCQVDNDRIIAYVKRDAASDNVILTIVNLDPHHVQSGWIEFDAATLAMDPGRPYQVHDLLSEQRFLWHGPRNFVSLDPQRAPAHVLRLRKYVRHEHDFDYYL